MNKVDERRPITIQQTDDPLEDVKKAGEVYDHFQERAQEYERIKAQEDDLVLQDNAIVFDNPFYLRFADGLVKMKLVLSSDSFNEIEKNKGRKNVKLECGVIKVVKPID